MRMPIQYALTYPDRASAPVPRLDWTQAATWTFDPPDFKKFPLLKLAYQAQTTGGSAACTLNAADEIAVEAFLAGQISYPAIAATISETLQRVAVSEPQSVSEVLEIDRASRQAARGIIEEGVFVKSHKKLTTQAVLGA
jgi:1-deoxy-D-xylulose-5-phosphate reductoisomerase